MSEFTFANCDCIAIHCRKSPFPISRAHSDLVVCNAQFSIVSCKFFVFLRNRFDKISLVLDCKNSNVTNMKTLLEAFNVVLVSKNLTVATRKLTIT